MLSFRDAGRAALGVGSLGFRQWVCIAFLWSPLLGVAQNGSSINAPDLRASVTVPPLVRPTPVLTPELRGDIYMARKMYHDAIDMYKNAATSPAIENKIGIAFHNLSQLQLAKKYYELAVKLDHHFPEAINNLGTLYYSERSYRKAIIYFKRSLKCSGPVASVYANLGAAYFGRRDYKNASVYYEKALTLDPDVLEQHSGFGTRIQETVRDRALFHLYLAKTYAKAGSDDRALGYLRKALEEGLKNRDKLAELPEFSTLRTTPEFQELLAENPKPL
ncbi:MAG: tetratricopeptide repeat protein [Acidobacteriota bacterium]|nr:tetratricopeptide repeat protein [Acidobacteriota bacterium]